MSWHDFDLLLRCSLIGHLKEALLAVPLYQHSLDPLILEEWLALFGQGKTVFLKQLAL